MRLARWVAVILWIAAAAYAFSVLSDPFATLADWATMGICLLFAALIALGGRPGLIAAIVGTGLAAVATLAGLAFTRWELSAVAAVLAVACALSVQEFRRTLAPR